MYVARGLLRVVNDSIDYFDYVVCLQAGYYRTLNSPIEQDQQIKLLPNPATTKVEVFAVRSNEVPSPIEMFNGLGEKIYDGMSEIGVLLKTIDVGSFSPGVYTVRVQQNEKFHLNKLVIIK